MFNNEQLVQSGEQFLTLFTEIALNYRLTEQEYDRNQDDKNNLTLKSLENNALNLYEVG